MPCLTRQGIGYLNENYADVPVPEQSGAVLIFVLGRVTLSP